MAKSGFTVEGMPQLLAKLDIIAMRARAAAQASIALEVEAVETDAKDAVPVRTGDARDGIIGEVEALDGTISATARHSKFIEHGTTKDPAQPFMGPAAESSRMRWPAKAAAIIKSAVEGI